MVGEDSSWAPEPTPWRHVDRWCGNHGVGIPESPPHTPPPLTALFPPGHLSVWSHESAPGSQQGTHTGDLQPGVGWEGRQAGQGELTGVAAHWPPEL